MTTHTNSRTKVQSVMKHSSIRVLVLTLLSGAFLLVSGTAFGQHQVSGTVLDSTEASPLPGVNVVVRGTTSGTTTGADGSYQLTAPSPTDTLVYSFVGYAEKEIPIRGRSEIDVSLAPTTLVGEELVVVGYGTQQRKDLTGSVSVVDVEGLKKSTQSSLAGALEGKVSGVSVQTTGAPGEEPSINVRGLGSFGGNAPLYIVDGVPVENIIDFNLNNVESVQVMKDAAASAIYGSRAANGVVIIETAGGEEGGLQVSYDGSVGTEYVHQRIDMLEREGFQELNNEMRRNAGEALAPGNDPDSPQFIDDVNTDWQEAAYERGYTTEHNLQISGGDETSTYSLSGNYQFNEGQMAGPAPSYRGISARINSTHELGRLTIGENISLTRSDERPQTVVLGNPFSLVHETLQAMPTVPVRDEDRLGGWGGPSASVQQGITMNTVAANHLVDREQEVNRGLINAWGELEIIEGLTYRLNLAYDSRQFHEEYFVPTYDLGFFFQEQEGRLENTKNELVNTTIENTLTYSNTFERHNVEAVVGYSEERRRLEQTFSGATGYSRPFFKTIDAGEENRSTGFKTESALRSVFGRLQYDYDNRYLFTAAIRRDGSSRFGDANRYGNFPSVSAGWRISDESFFEVGWVSDLKLRASWGQLGRQAIGDFETSAFINTSADYSFNDEIAPGATQVSLVNSNLKWESQTSRTIGVDAGLFDGRLEFTVEYYRNDSEDILVGVPIPGSLGSAENPTVNAATIRNTGFDFSVGYNSSFGELTYDVNANVSTLNNEVLSLGANGEPIFGAASKTEVGSEVGELFGWVTDGILQSEDEICRDPTGQACQQSEELSAYQQPGTAPGDIRFKDLNGDGIINDQDRDFLGSPTPDFTYGLNVDLEYRNFDASFFVQGNYGNKIFSSTRRVVEDMTDFNNQTVRVAKNHWTPDNKHNDVRFPRAVWGDPNDNGRDSDRFVEDGSYLRMKSLTIGYTVPSDVTDLLGARSLRVYASSSNLFTITGYEGGLDPEIGTGGGGGINNIANDGLFSRGFDDGAWPHPRRFEAGVQLNF